VRYCRRLGLPFTTSYHTQFPHYLHEYFRVPKAITYRFLRWLHGSAEHVLVPTATVGKELESQGFDNITVWCRGVDTELFRPYDEPGVLTDLPRPIFLYAGRVALEKNIEAFLKLDLPGSKVIVGDGPIREKLQRQYPGAFWAGYQFGEALARHYAAADVFVFPSKTDTFGIVMLEANAAGLPVAAYPVTGPIDVVKHGQTGILDEDLANACLAALPLDRATCRQYAIDNSWSKVAQQVLDTAAIIPRAMETPPMDNAIPQPARV
jgi:glycosyltransferase involved in cell wall biosynthesis